MTTPAWAYKVIPSFGQVPGRCLSTETFEALRAENKLRRFSQLCITLGVFLEESTNRRFEVIKDHDKLFERIAEIALLPEGDAATHLRALLSDEYFENFDPSRPTDKDAPPPFSWKVEWDE